MHPFEWDDPQTTARKARVVADDDRYVDEVGSKAREEVEGGSDEEVEAEQDGERKSAHREVLCGQLSSCRQAATAGTSGFPSVLNEGH